MLVKSYQHLCNLVLPNNRWMTMKYCFLVKSQKQSISDATVASARIVARITQTSGRNPSKTHYSMCHIGMPYSQSRMLCGPLWGDVVFCKRFWWMRQSQQSTTQFHTSTELIDHLFKKYREGFYVHLPKESRITNKFQNDTVLRCLQP